MNKTNSVVLLLAIVGCFVAAPAIAQLTRPAPPQRTSAPRWEYSVITRANYAGSVRGGIYWIGYLREAGVQVVEVEGSAVENNGFAKAVATLGNEGWEMVGDGPLEFRPGGASALYFRRPKR